MTTTQRWTTDRVMPLQKDELYTVSLGYVLPSATTATLSVAHEVVGPAQGVYAGFRLTQTFTTCSRCLAKGSFY